MPRFIIESSPHTDHQAMDLSLMCIHPVFLFGRAQTHPDEVCLRGIDFFNDLPVFLFRHGTEGGLYIPAI